MAGTAVTTVTVMVATAVNRSLERLFGHRERAVCVFTGEQDPQPGVANIE
jgi:hypothetical protein